MSAIGGYLASIFCHEHRMRMQARDRTTSSSTYPLFLQADVHALAAREGRAVFSAGRPPYRVARTGVDETVIDETSG